MRLLVVNLLLVAALFFPGSLQALVLDWSSVTWTAGSLSANYDIDPSNPGNDITITITGTTALLKVMNESFSSPLVIANKGGNARGGAQLTETGKEALEIYDAMVEESKKATQKSWEKLRGLLKPTVRNNLPKKAATSA